MGASLYPPPAATAEEITSGATIAAGFTLTSFYAKRRAGVCTFALYAVVDTTIVHSSTNPTNISDTLIATLPAGWTPPAVLNTIYSTGILDGECTIGTDGAVLLRTTGYNLDVPAGANIRISDTFVL